MFLRDELVQVLMEMGGDGPGPVTDITAIAIWQRLMAQCARLLGPRWIDALFVRSLDANRAAFPWLPAPQPRQSGRALFQMFASRLSGQPRQEVDRATRALLGTYIDLLFTTIGTTLTAQAICSIAAGHAR